jgi:hypothetical protein
MEESMDKKCYSTNGEDFNDSEMDDAAQSVFDYVGAKAGDVRTIFEGTARKHLASDFAPDLIDTLSEQAYNDLGEYAEDWLEGVTKEERDDLDARIKDVINSWADDNGHEPSFYSVDDSREIQVRLLDDEGKWEEVPCSACGLPDCNCARIEAV